MSLEMSVMDIMPDEVLVEVLQYVDVPDLLRCRMVCKRLQALVRDEEVWRHREVRLDDCLPDGSLRYPPASPSERGPLHLLSLAPCLDHLYICAAAGTLRALTTTKCAVARLTLSNSHLRFNALLYTQVVRHQEALGRLRCVHLYCQDDDNACGVFLDTLLTCPRLESLTGSINGNLIFSKFRRSTALFASPVAPSLRKFSWHFFPETAPFVHAVLAGHSATLEDVKLGTDLNFTDDTLAPILGALPKLHSLRFTFPNLPGLEAVAACGTLRMLSVASVEVNPSVARPYPGVVELLRRAKQLRDVRLRLYWPILEGELAEALASPGLERLELEFYGFTEVWPLLRVLSALPALRHLVLDDAFFRLTPLLFCDLLLGITPARAPALRILELRMGTRPCLHSKIHVYEDAVRTALITNPSLHIQLRFTGAQGCCKRSYCVECALDCHKDILKAGVGTSDILEVSMHLHKLEIAIGSRVLPSRGLETF